MQPFENLQKKTDAKHEEMRNVLRFIDIQIDFGMYWFFF